MATQIFFTNGATVPCKWSSGNNDADFAGNAQGWNYSDLTDTRGDAAVSVAVNTVNGATNGIELGDIRFVSPPISADFTLAGTVTFNLRAAESSMNANAAINCALYKIDGATGAITLVVKTARVTELGTSEAAANFTASPTSTAFKRGDRIMAVVFADDAGTMATGFTVTFWYDGPTAAASGDSYFSLTETISFESTPAGTTVYPIDSDATGLSAVDSVGPFFPGTFETLTRGGTQPDWVNPSNAGADDGTYATCAVTGQAGTDYLVARNWGLSIPAGASVRGVKVEVQAKSSVNGTGNITLRLQGADGNVTGPSDTFVGTLTDADALYSFGALNNTFGGGLLGAILTPTDLNDIDFGVRVWSDVTGTYTVSIDYVKVTVWYEVNGRWFEQEVWTSRGSGVVQRTTDFNGPGWMAAKQLHSSTSSGMQIEWYTRQLQAFTLGGAILANLRMLEESASGNYSAKCEIAVVNSDGSSPVVWGSTLTPDELGIAQTALQFWVAGDDLAVTDGQRIRVRVYIDDSGLNPGGNNFFVQLFYSGTSGGASGDTFLTLSNTLTEFTGGPISPSAISSAQTVPNPTLLPGNVNIIPGAIASGEVIGAHALKATNQIFPTAIESGESVGTPTLLAGNVNIQPTEIVGAEVVGNPTLLPGNVNIQPGAIASAENIGTPALVATIPSQTIIPTAIDGAEAVGTPTLIPGNIAIQPTAINSEESVSSPLLLAVASILPEAIASAESVGTPTLTPGNANILPTAVASAEVVGNPTLSPGNVNILPGTINSQELVGIPTLTVPGQSVIQPSSIDSAELVGNPVLAATVNVLPSAINSAESVGNPTLLPGSVVIAVTAINSAEAVGSPTLVTSALILPTTIGSAESVSNPTLQPGVVLVIVSGVPSAESVGAPILVQAAPGAQNILPSAIASAEALGSPTLLPGTVSISPASVGPQEALGTPIVIPGLVTIAPQGVGSGEFFGLPSLLYFNLFSPESIASAEVFGFPTLIPGVTFIDPGSISSGEAVGNPVIRAGKQSWRWVNSSRGWKTTRTAEPVVMQDGFGRTRRNEGD